MDRDRSLDIAVTGMAARFPRAGDMAAWWSAIMAGRVLVSRLERRELIQAGVDPRLVDDPDYVPVHGCLEGFDRFDETLFQIRPREAEMMDPQQRLMLETAWNALEDAGCAPGRDEFRTAVYASASGSGYMRSMVAGGGLDPMTLEDAIHGTEPDFMASLISYKLGLTGPAVAVQTACSSSLVAVHLAIQALLGGDCDQAVVVGAGIAYPQAGHLYTEGGIHSPSGRCRPFDAAADGVVAGSGVACVVLRRLSDVITDLCEPHGVILGTAVNNDGAAKVGYFAPSAGGQEAVIRAALTAADVTADSLGYLEAHATGTRVGDPIEWSAASAALSEAAPGQIAVGALKANTGHLDNAAGLASLIKALLVVRTGMVPPVAGFIRLNPLLETDGSPLSLPTEARRWTGPRPRRAGVSSFGIGGTNAHAIVEQPPPLSPRAPYDRPARVVLLSAADPEALSRAAARLGEHLESTEPDLRDVSFTLAHGRAELPHRLAVGGGDTAEVAKRLRTGVGVVRGRADDIPAPLVFAFPGQGSQSPGMALPFAANLPGFAEAMDACLEAFTPDLAARLRAVLYDRAADGSELTATELAQPALFAVEYAVASALTASGLAPAALVGHSLGEIVSACLAGVFSLPDAARFVAVRGAAMQACPTGAMLALGCDAAEARALLAESGRDVELAAENSPHVCVVAGRVEEVSALESCLEGRLFTRRLRTERAFHSALVDPALPVLEAELAGIDLRPAVIPFASNVAGRLVPVGTRPDPACFVEQARRPVMFAQAVAAVAADLQDAIVVEAGPGGTLSALVATAGLTAIALSPSRAEGEVPDALARLWTLGQPVDVRSLCAAGRRIHLPGYSFAGPRRIAPEAAGGGETVAVSATAPAGDRAHASERDISAAVTRLWRELLGHAELSADSDFFLLGGDSLLTVHLGRRIRHDLGAHVTMRDLLTTRTLQDQIELVRGRVGGDRDAVLSR